MSRGKTTCKVLKEVRRKIADANDIPLPERECTHTGDCAGTCPYCESEVRYLERELSKRKSLGKAVAVAGIALSAVTMAGCATSESATTDSSNKPRKTSGREVMEALSYMGVVPVDDNSQSKACKQDPDTLDEQTFVTVGIVETIDMRPSDPPSPESIPSYRPAVFTEGVFEDWLGGQLQKYQSYMQDSRLDEVEIRFFVEEDGSVSTVNILNMPEFYEQKDEAFRVKVIAVISGTEWKPATVSDKPVSSIVTVRLRDLR